MTALCLFMVDASAKAPVEPPVCSGTNYLAELEKNDPAAFAELRKQADATPNGKGIFWKIEREGTETSYLLGTMHVTDPRIVAMPEEAHEPFADAWTVALELESLEPMDVGRVLFAHPELTMFTDGTSVKTLLDPQELNRLEIALTERGIPLFAVAKMKPWMLLMNISFPACELKRVAAGLQPLDRALINTAHEQDQLVVGLETALEQLQSLDAIAAAPLLRAILMQMEAGKKSDDFFATMMDMYLAGDIGMMLPASYHLMGMTMAQEDPNDDLMKHLITDRNIRMAERAAPLLVDGNAFIAVGAMHLIGKQGLVELFRKQGYTVTRLH